MKLYTAAEAAELLGITLKSIDSQVRRYGLKAIQGKSVSSYRFTLEAIQERQAKRDENVAARHKWNGSSIEIARRMKAAS